MDLLELHQGKRDQKAIYKQRREGGRGGMGKRETSPPTPDGKATV